MRGRTNRFVTGVAVTLLSVGCEANDAGRSPAATGRAQETPVGPHNGALVEWGEEHHAEFVADREKGEATVYVLGRNARTPAPVAADEVVLTLDDPAVRVVLKPAPEARDPKGTSSRFVGNLPVAARGWRITGIVSGVVDGKRMSGEVVEFRPHKH